MKDVKTIVISVITIIMIIIAIVALCIFSVVSILEYKTNQTSDLVKTITTVLTCIISATSLFFTCKNRKESIRNIDISRKKDVENSWFCNVVIDRNFNSISEFFINCEKLVDTYKDINLNCKEMKMEELDAKIKQDIIMPFTDKYIKIQQNLLLDTSIINDDLSTRIKESFESFQDSFISFTENRNPNYDSMKAVVLEHQKKLMIDLKEYQLSI